MLVLNQLVEIKWHPRNKERLENLGYKYTKIGDNVLVNIKDLSDGCKSYVEVEYDYCGKRYKKRYKDYLNQRSNDKDCCIECVAFKRSETNMIKYGGNAPACDKEIVNKIKNTCIEKYGVNSPMRTEEVKARLRQSVFNKYGVENIFQSKEVIAKIKRTWYENGTAPISKPQLELYNMLSNIYNSNEVFCNYPMESLSLDCLLIIDGFNIDIEYDGMYWHKDRKNQDRKRNYYLLDRGYKILRIKANKKDTLPSEQQLKEAIDYLVKDNHSLVYIDMNV